MIDLVVLLILLVGELVAVTAVLAGMVQMPVWWWVLAAVLLYLTVFALFRVVRRLHG